MQPVQQVVQRRVDAADGARIVVAQEVVQRLQRRQARRRPFGLVETIQPKAAARAGQPEFLLSIAGAEATVAPEREGRLSGAQGLEQADDFTHVVAVAEAQGRRPQDVAAGPVAFGAWCGCLPSSGLLSAA